MKDKSKLKEIIRRAMAMASPGDDLARANASFRGLSPSELKQEFGESGSTNEEIWNSYKEEYATWKEANDYLETLLKS